MVMEEVKTPQKREVFVHAHTSTSSSTKKEAAHKGQLVKQ